MSVELVGTFPRRWVLQLYVPNLISPRVKQITQSNYDVNWECSSIFSMAGVLMIKHIENWAKDHS